MISPPGFTLSIFSIHEEAQRIGPRVNFSGTLRERGTRVPIAEAQVVIAFPSAPADVTLPVPWSAYLERIGEFDGQYVEGDRLVTYTDERGRFEFTSLPPGSLQVSFPNAGYQAHESREVLGARAACRLFLSNDRGESALTSSDATSPQQRSTR